MPHSSASRHPCVLSRKHQVSDPTSAHQKDVGLPVLVACGRYDRILWATHNNGFVWEACSARAAREVEEQGQALATVMACFVMQACHQLTLTALSRISLQNTLH